MTVRERIYRLVDTLPDAELETAGRVLAGLSALSLAGSAAATLARAPLDDELVTAGEAAALGERGA